MNTVMKVLATSAGLVLTGAGRSAPAFAAQDGVLHEGDFGFYYNSATATSFCKGSLADYSPTKYKATFTTSDNFISAGSGQGQDVKNNSACVANTRSVNARVYFNSNCGGVNDTIPGNQFGNLTNTYNENASFEWAPFHTAAGCS